MGVYINMEMPKSCAFCRFYGAYCYAKGDEDVHSTLPCPLVPVPPHGKLIAEDDAIKTAWMILEGLGYRKEENKQLEQTVREVFATAPASEVE